MLDYHLKIKVVNTVNGSGSRGQDSEEGMNVPPCPPPNEALYSRYLSIVGIIPNLSGFISNLQGKWLFRWVATCQRWPLIYYCTSFIVFIIDGHHKLVRWRLVTHCAIDGYSRLVLFIVCSNNNRSRTVYDHFLKATNQYGLPSRIRCDQGLENILVARHMLHHRGVERRSVLVGSSVHNQRVERLWRDSHRCVTSTFYRLFYYLEVNSMLDPIDEVHLLALQYVFLPRINRALSQFRDAWNNHGIRTERSQTPNQLFTAGVLRQQLSGVAALDFFYNVPDDYGTGEEGVAPNEDSISIPQIHIELSEEQETLLRETIDPLEYNDDYGVSLFLRTLQLLMTFNLQP